MARRYHEIKGPAEFTAKEMYSDKNRPSQRRTREFENNAS